MTRLGVFSTHPIQYQVPLWRRMSSNPELDVRVFYFSDQGVSQNIDPGFGHVVSWDLPLLEGYEYEFLSKAPIEKADGFRIDGFDDLMAEQKFDAILLHGYTHRFARQIIRGKKTHNYKVILRAEFTEMPRRAFNWKSIPRKMYLDWFYRSVDHFNPIGKDGMSHLKTYGIPESKITLSPYAVDDQLFENKSKSLDKRKCRTSLQIGEEEKVFLFSGKLIPRKQPLLLAKAVLKLCEEFPKLVVSYLGSGPQYDELKQMLEPRLGRRFIAPGFVNQSELGPHFKSADVFVLPSTYDTWGLVINEAMHFGLPCIVSDMVGSRHDLVESGKTGLVFNHESSNDLASCMKRFLEEDGLSDRMGANAHDLIQKYTIEEAVIGIETAIRKLS
jgi:glycosyltransferase involved in cell wall biosynthesis